RDADGTPSWGRGGRQRGLARRANRARRQTAHPDLTKSVEKSPDRHQKSAKSLCSLCILRLAATRALIRGGAMISARRTTSVVTAAFLAVFIADRTSAQNIGATLQGLVTDEQHAVLPGVTVSISN